LIVTVTTLVLGGTAGVVALDVALLGELVAVVVEELLDELVVLLVELELSSPDEQADAASTPASTATVTSGRADFMNSPWSDDGCAVRRAPPRG
jgi:hypothetical protein